MKKITVVLMIFTLFLGCSREVLKFGRLQSIDNLITVANTAGNSVENDKEEDDYLGRLHDVKTVQTPVKGNFDVVIVKPFDLQEDFPMGMFEYPKAEQKKILSTRMLVVSIIIISTITIAGILWCYSSKDNSNTAVEIVPKDQPISLMSLVKAPIRTLVSCYHLVCPVQPPSPIEDEDIIGLQELVLDPMSLWQDVAGCVERIDSNGKINLIPKILSDKIFKFFLRIVQDRSLPDDLFQVAVNTIAHLKRMKEISMVYTVECLYRHIYICLDLNF